MCCQNRISLNFFCSYNTYMQRWIGEAQTTTIVETHHYNRHWYQLKPHHHKYKKRLLKTSPILSVSQQHQRKSSDRNQTYSYRYHCSNTITTLTLQVHLVGSFPLGSTCFVVDIVHSLGIRINNSFPGVLPGIWFNSSRLSMSFLVNVSNFGSAGAQAVVIVKYGQTAQSNETRYLFTGW